MNNRNKDPAWSSGLEPGERSKTSFNQEQRHGSNIQGGVFGWMWTQLLPHDPDLD